MSCRECGAPLETRAVECAECGAGDPTRAADPTVASAPASPPPVPVSAPTWSPIPSGPAPPPPPWPGAESPSRAARTRSSASSLYLSLHGLATALTWLLAVEVVAALALAGAYVNRRHVLERFLDGHYVSFADARRADDAVSTIAGWAILVGLAIFVVLIIFLFRASKNTELWEAERPRWSAGWTIAGWFIPVGGLLIPALVVREIAARTPSLDGARRPRPVSDALVWVWWAPWVLGLLVLRFGPDPTTADQQLAADARRIAAALLLAAAGAVLLVVVRRLDRRQQQLALVPTRCG